MFEMCALERFILPSGSFFCFFFQLTRDIVIVFISTVKYDFKCMYAHLTQTMIFNCIGPTCGTDAIQDAAQIRICVKLILMRCFHDGDDVCAVYS